MPNVAPTYTELSAGIKGNASAALRPSRHPHNSNSRDISSGYPAGELQVHIIISAIGRNETYVDWEYFEGEENTSTPAN